MELQAFATMPNIIYLGSGGSNLDLQGKSSHLQGKHFTMTSGAHLVILLVVLETAPRSLLLLGKSLTTRLHVYPWNILHQGMVG